MSAILEICKLRHLTGQNQLGCSSDLITEMKRHPCVNFGACIRIRTLWCFIGPYAAVNVFPDPPHRGAGWGLPRGLPGGLLFVQVPGVWGFSQVLSPDWNHGICLY